MASISDVAIDQIFRGARSIQTFLPRTVSEETLRSLYDLVKLGPTGFNSQPARFLFLTTKEAKARLAPALSSGNRDKTLAAPVNVILAWDSRFYDELPEQFPAYDAKTFFENNSAWIEPTAARSLGLDVGPMSGFSAEKIDAEFFAGSTWQSLLLANIGYGDHTDMKGRGPRLDYAKAVSIL
jgi:3-hydroxypropanoate dehydrogenase